MKICFLTHDVRNDYGAGVFSRRLISGIKEHLDWDVVLLTSEASGSPFETAILYPRKINLLKEFFHIRRIIKDCDIVHALDGFPYGMIAVLASLGYKKKIVITGAGSGAILPLHRPIYGPVMRWCYRRATAVTAISTFTRDEILKKVKNLTVRVINHGVDLEQFERKGEIPADIAAYTPYLLSVGTLRWRKGYHLSIRSFANIVREFPHLHYVIVGKYYKDDYYLRLKQIINDLGLDKKVHLLTDIHSQEKLVRIYQNAELFCLFSQNVNHDVEGFGLVFLEAAAAGLPVVGAKNCGVDDAVQEGNNGLLVDTRSPEDFAHAILAILRDNALKRRMSLMSRAYARQCTWEKRIEEYIRLYKALGGVS